MKDMTAGLPADNTTTSNEPVSSSEPISLGGGEAVNFDQLDAVQSNSSDAASSVPNEKAAAKPEKKEKKEAKGDDIKDEDSEKEDSSKEKVKEAVEKVKKDAKLYKIKVGDKDLDIAADGSLSIDKDGKTVPVTIQDLVNSYHGTSEIHRRLTDLDVKSKKFDTDRKTVDTFVDKVAEFYKNDKPLELVDFLINTAGLDPAMYKMRLLESLTPEVEQFSSMTTEEKKAHQLALENEYLRKRQQEIVSTQQSTQEFSKLESHVKTIQQQKGLDDAGFYNLYRELVDEGGFDENQLTPEDIADYADYKAMSTHISNEIKAINPEYEGIDELASELVDEMSENSVLTMDDVKDIIKQIVVDTSEEDLKEKLSEKKPKASPPKNPMSEPLTFDDLAF